MAKIKPHFFNSKFALLALLEWTAIQKILFKGNQQDMAEAFPDMHHTHAAWVAAFDRQAKPEHRNIYAEIIKGDIATLPAFYARIDKFVTPRTAPVKPRRKVRSKPAGKAARDGVDIIQNQPLLDDIKIMAFELAEQNRTPESATDRVVQLMVKHNFFTPSDGQIKLLFEYLEQQMANHLLLDRVEAAIIDTDDKNLIFMWNKIKRRYPKDDNFVWPSSIAAKEGKCSKSEVRPIMQKLETLGAITRLESGERGGYSKRAALYRREI